MVSSACGNGPSGPSFDASFTTRSRPSSRWTSSTGLPGSYGIRPANAGRTKPAGRSATLGAGARTLVRLLAPEPECSADGGEDRGDRGLVQPGVIACPGHGRARLLPAEPLRDLPHTPTEHGVPSIDDSHIPLLSVVEPTNVFPADEKGNPRDRVGGPWGSGDEGTSVREDSGRPESLRVFFRAFCPPAGRGCRRGPEAAAASGWPSRARCDGRSRDATGGPGSPGRGGTRRWHLSRSASGVHGLCRSRCVSCRSRSRRGCALPAFA